MKCFKIERSLCVRLWGLILCLPGLAGPVSAGESRVPEGQSLSDGEYVSVQDGHFVYRGERLRLWGTNYVNYVMRRDADLELNMDRLVDAGFNGIRLNLFDRTFIPDPEKEPFFVPETIQGSGSRMDLLDRSIYEAKQRGVFFWFTFDLRWKARPADYDILPDDGTREAWVAMSKQYPLRYAMFFDPRSERIYERFAGSLLDHYNPYTERRYADEETIAMWEITNENGFIDSITAKPPEGLAKELLTQRWNAWLAERYKTDEALSTAWGGLSEGESIRDTSVVFAPLRDTLEVVNAGNQITYVSKAGGVSAYSEARASDVIRFATDLFIDHSQRFIRFFRKQGKGTAVAPITPTGRYGNSWPMYYAAAVGGDFVSAGNYSFSYRPWEVSEDSPHFPHVIRLNSSPTMETPIDLIRLKDKPFAVYECADYRPNPYAIEFPMRMLTYALWADADAVFWFHWDDLHYIKNVHTDEDYTKTPLPMPVPSHGNAGLVQANDETLLSALKAASNVFRNSGVAPAPDPVVAKLGADLIFDAGAENGLSSFESYETMRGYAWNEGFRVAYDPEGETVLPAAKKRGGTVARMGEAIEADWGNDRGHMQIDAPTAKVWAGFVDGEIDFGGLHVSGVTRDWAWLSLSAADGKPLAESGEMLLSLAYRSTNEGMHHDPSRYDGGWHKGLGKAVTHVGHKPLIERVGASFEAPWLKGKWVYRFDFARRCYAGGRLESGRIDVSESEPLFYALVSDEQMAITYNPDAFWNEAEVNASLKEGRADNDKDVAEAFWSFRTRKSGKPVPSDAVAMDPAMEAGTKTLLVLGNSITWHPESDKLGWHGRWGEEKDYAHVLYAKYRDYYEAEGTQPTRLIVKSFIEPFLTSHPEKTEQVVDQARQADVIVVQMGDNIKSDNVNEATVTIPYAALMSKLKAANPDVLIFGVSLWGVDPKRNQLLEEGCRRAGVEWINLGNLMRDRNNRAVSEGHFTHSGVNWHPGDRGMAAMAEVIWSKIKPSLQQQAR